MIAFPCAKINLGLNIVGVRDDGYHNLETVFYPIPIQDALEIRTMSEDFPSEVPCDIKVTGATVEGDEADNLVVRAYHLIAADYDIPRVHAHLHKHIPSQAGLGGGSSDGAFMIRLLDERYRLNLGNSEMERYAARLGADCPFFISAEPSYADGIGTHLMPADTPQGNLVGYWVAVVKPPVAISTKAAYAQIVPKQPAECCRDIVREPIATWRGRLVNDFEEPAFAQHPELAAIKERLYNAGALYASMTGSGSAFYGIFGQEPRLDGQFPGCFLETVRL